MPVFYHILQSYVMNRGLKQMLALALVPITPRLLNDQGELFFASP